jgi:hypothetical protein
MNFFSKRYPFSINKDGKQTIKVYKYFYLIKHKIILNNNQGSHKKRKIRIRLNNFIDFNVILLFFIFIHWFLLTYFKLIFKFNNLNKVSTKYYIGYKRYKKLILYYLRFYMMYK